MEGSILHAYLAGLFDGEGTVTLTKDSTYDRFRIPVLSMSSTSLNLLELCKQTFGGSISKQKTYKDHHKQSWSWKVSNRRAIVAAEQLIPYIQEPAKKRRLQLIISTYLSVTQRNGRYNEEMLKAKLAFEHQFFHPSDSVAVP